MGGDGWQIAVMDEGRLVEMAPPAELLAKQGGAFSSMVATVSKIAALRLPVFFWLQVSFMSGNLGANTFVSQYFK